MQLVATVVAVVLPLSRALLQNRGAIVAVQSGTSLQARVSQVAPSIAIATGPAVLMPKVMFGMGGALVDELREPGAAGVEAHQQIQSAAELWLSLGGRGLDTAQAYTDEPETGNAWRNSGLPRESVFILSKFEPSEFLSNDTRKETRRLVEKSLNDIGIDYLDLMLIHHPGSANDNAAMWEELQATRVEGKIRAIGVSNFEVTELQALMATAQVPIALNQRSMNVFAPDTQNFQFCLDHNITYQAYTPLGDGSVLDDPVVADIAEHHGRSAAQVALRWIIQRGGVLSTQSESADHQRENLDLFDWALSEDEMLRLNALGS